jgi:hypothetical protein
MKNLIIPALAGTLFLGGCAELLRNTTPTVSVLENKASIVVRTQVVPGGVRTAATIPNLTADSINHLVLQIFELDGNTETPILDANNQEIRQDLTRNQLGSLITFGDLKPQTTYRIRAYAYSAPGTDAQNLISTSDAGSYVDVEVQTDDRPTVTTLKVKLIDVDFSGQGTFQGVTVTPGGYRPTGPVTISITPAEALLNEGSPAIQGMLDNVYRPIFADGMTWTYQTVTTVAGVPTTRTLTQVVSGVTLDGFTLTETATASDAPEPQTTAKPMTASQWYPPASELRDLGYEAVTVLAGTYEGDTNKFAAAKNTAVDRQYYWLSGNGGLILMTHAYTNDQGHDVTIRHELVSFTQQ